MGVTRRALAERRERESLTALLTILTPLAAGTDGLDDGDREAALAALERFASAVREVLATGPAAPGLAARAADAAATQLERYAAGEATDERRSGR